MNRLAIRKILVLSFSFFLTVTFCEARTFGATILHRHLISMPDMPSQQKKSKVSKPKSARKVQKEADKKEKQQDKDYAKFVKENKKRSIEIQTPEVKARMKQNVKNADANYKTKKKNNASRTKSAGKKYR